ncbi:tetratricopeptide repeat protein [Thalassospira xianhensis]|uniref:protein O-GlcNAc transferase n=1 Tax=Thalassospira xianhensis MCCC 1A02616 TaxID=1177929 RepID=A0A367U9C0_9PROT|nr:tetratricopeptide repeat protein [Thalassospira xianhensis]RCK04313.1 acetylglucosamine transferase [Thalassospira xianhensis MCCC 1A02616]
MSADLKTLLRRGLSAHEGNRPDEAEKIYRRALSLSPGNPEVEHLLATLLTGLDRHREALELFDSCLPRLGANPAVRCNFAIALERAGLIEKAIDEFRQAISYHGDFPTALYHLARLEMPRGHVGQTVDLLGRLLGLKPDHYEGLLLFGEALHALGQEEAALTSLDRAAEAAGITPDMICRVGDVSLRLGYPGMAQNLYQRALSIDPRHVPALHGLGRALSAQGDYAKAIAILKTAKRLAKGRIEIDLEIADIELRCGDIASAIAELTVLVEKHPANANAHTALLAAVARLPDIGGVEYLKQARQWARSHMPAMAEPKFINSKQVDKRLRIGWLSPHFCEHACFALLSSVARHLNRNEVELFLYSATPRPDQTTRSWQVMADGWREIYGQSPLQITERIRKDRVDILFDLTGPVPDQPITVFAHRAAPVQASTAPMTTGISQMDYILVHHRAIPSRPAENKLFCENVQHLGSGPFAYAGADDAAPLSLLPAAIDEVVTFGCFDQLSNISDASLNCFARVLNKVKNSRLVIQDDVLGDAFAKKTMLDRLRQAGLHSDRVNLIGAVSPEDKPDLYARIDIGLAPFPMIDIARYFDMLWHGIPFVTMAGETPASRAGLCLLSDIGLDALAAETQKGYVEKALLLTQDINALTTIRAGMRDRMKNSKAMSGPAAARELEEASRDMWKTWCAL